MAKNTKTWIIAILVIAAALFVAGMYTQKEHPLFSLTTSYNCLDWAINNGVASQGSSVLPSVPLTWAYTSTQYRCITAFTVSGSGCNVAYNTGACAATTCTESWTCGAWSTCSSNSQSRTCTDTNNCGTTTTKPATTQSCTSGTTTPTCVSFTQLIQYANQWANC